VPDNPKIEELRRRMQRDPTSIAFAQLAEEYRRAGRFQEAIETCCAGLEQHPGYLSARVTLGRSLIEVGEIDHAQLELAQVLSAAPENLAALRGLAEIHHRRGDLPDALRYYRSALDLAQHDPDLEQVVQEITRQLGASVRAPGVPEGLTFEQAREELLAIANPAAANPPATEGPPSAPLVPEAASAGDLVIARQQLALFERWLGAITEERRRRREVQS
jgi:tetratricopeptide (TPR) repeat protein